MAFNGGVFSRIYNWVSDANSSIPITASRMDAEMDGMATGLSTCVLKDGTQVITADLPMAGFKHTGVGAATARNHYATVAGVQDNLYTWGSTAAGTGNAITVTTTPVTTSLLAGRTLRFISSAANTTAVTLAENGLTAKAITKNGTTALVSGDIPSGALVTVTYDSTQYQLESATTVQTAFFPPQGRLTLTSATPILTADATAQTSVYYTPYIGNKINIYNGTFFVSQTFTELTLTLNTSNHVSGNLYDVFIWNNAGTISVGTGPAWSSATSRGTGAGTTELQMLNGIWTNKVSASMVNGASGSVTADTGANRCAYVGTIYMTANGQTGMMFKPAAASGGSANILGLYNAYNRVKIQSICRDNSAAYTYGTNTWRKADNNANNSISFVHGLQQTSITARFKAAAATATATDSVTIGVNLDSQSATPALFGFASTPTATLADNYQTISVEESYTPQLGFHYVQAMENSPNGVTATFNPGGNTFSLIMDSEY